MLQSVITYRQAFYDFIYKSHRNKVSSHAFRKILLRSIDYSIAQDEVGSYGHTEERAIRNKLNILFSLWDHFDGGYQNSSIMKQSIRDLPERVRQVVHRATGEEAIHLKSEDEFAYLAGQAIRYIFQQVRTDAAPHAKLTPYLNVRSAGKLAEKISRLYEQYNHIQN